MEDARYWISHEWGRKLGLEVEYHGGNLIPPALAGPATVLNNLDRVSTGHPTRTIRAAARALHDELDGIYNMIRCGEAISRAWKTSVRGVSRLTRSSSIFMSPVLSAKMGGELWALTPQ